MKRFWTVFLCMFTAIAGAFNAKELSMKLLNQQEQSIIEISTLTATGETEKLVSALNNALDRGLNINEVNEVLVQTYAYAGFPRSLGGIFTFMKVVDERKAKGIQDKRGKETSPLPKTFDRDTYGARVRADLAGQKEIPEPGGYQLFSPIIDQFLKEHLFADIFVRDILTPKQRELSTISVLAALGNVAGPFKFHYQASMNMGWTKEELLEFIKVIENSLGKRKAQEALEVLESI